MALGTPLQELLIAASVETSGVTRGLASAIAQLQGFERQTAKLATHQLALTVDVDHKPVDDLNARIGAARKAAEAPIQVAVTPIAPLTPPPPPDFSATITEATRAGAIVREEFESALRGSSNVLANDAFQAGMAAGRELQAGLLTTLEQIRGRVAAGLITPAEATRQIDIALEAMSRELAAKQAALPPVQIKALVLPPLARGLTTGASPSIIPTAELDEAERKFEDLIGASAATSQSFLKVGSSSSQMRHGVRGAASALGILAAQSVGATGPLGRLAGNIVLLSGGVGRLAAVAGGVLAVVAVFEAITKKSREAKEATDNAIDSLLKLHDAQRDPVRVRLEETGEAVQRLDEIREKVAALVEEQQRLEAHPLVFGDRGGDQTFARLTFIQGRLVELGHEFVKTGTAASAGGLDIASESARQLAEALKLGTASAADIQKATAEVSRLNAMIRAGTGDLSARNQAQQQANALIEALQAPALRQIDLQKQATEEAIAAVTGLGKVQAQVAAGPGLEALIAKYRALEQAAAGDTDQVQRLADARHGIEQLARSTDDALKAFANIGGLSKGLPVLEFKATLDFSSPIEAIVDVLTGRAEARIRANLNAILAELKQRSDRQFDLELGPIALPDTGISAGFDRAQESVAGLNEELTLAAFKANAFFRQAFRGAAGLNDRLHVVTRAIDEVVAAARGIGAIGDEAVHAIGGVLNLIDTLGDLKQANEAIANATTAAESSAANLAKIGAIGGLIGAGIGVLGSLFGPSQAEIEGNRIRQENNERLRELTAVMDASIQGIGGEGRVAVAAGRLAADPNIEAATRLLELSGHLAEGQRFFEEQVRAAGVSLEQLQQVAKDHGITLLDSEGRLVAGSLAALRDALELSIEAATSFAQTLDDQLRRVDLESRLRGEPQDEASRFQREVEAASGLSDAVKDAFKGVDLGNEAAVRAASVGLFDQFDAGVFTEHPELLGKLSKDDFLKFLEDAAGHLDAFDEAVDAATRSTLNLPQGFRLAALAFAASDVGPPPGVAAPLPPGLTPNIDPGRLAPVVEIPNLEVIAAPLQENTAALEKIATSTPRDLLDAVGGVEEGLDALAHALGLSTTPGTKAGSGSSTFPPPGVTTGPLQKLADTINITVTGTNKDPRDVADEVLDQLRQKAMTQTGDTLQLGGLT